MSVAIVLAFVILVITLLVAAIQVMAAAMSDAGSEGLGFSLIATIVTGSIIAGLVALSHFIPAGSW